MILEAAWGRGAQLLDNLIDIGRADAIHILVGNFS